ncbi:DNA methylase [Pseudomonas sp. RW4S2]|uniref:DNA methylase n=2 Tax=Pseudomonas vlassakiae TaxID=485888 RepID=A0A923K3K4_9PSED|nr:DNA methylase [Pseudomonas vlassakiae]
MRELKINAPGCRIRDLGLFKWLLASFLMGKPIRSTVAVKAYQALVHEQGLDTPLKLVQISHSVLVRLLGQAGYTRYDESTARRLHALANKFEVELAAQLEALQGATGIEGFKRWLMEFEGIGPKTVEIFLREGRAQLTTLVGR